MDASLVERTQAWIDQDPDSTTAAELRRLLDAADEKALAERMAGPLEFGTAGLRGLLGAGESLMNRAVVLRTAAGLGKYLLSQPTLEAPRRGVLVGYDGRHFSRTFAEDTARVLTFLGIPVYVYSHVTSTPSVSFGVLHLGCAAGVMVTASHNPPAYNGYKVYWEDGAQVIPPHDAAIARAVATGGGAKEIPCLDEPEARGRGLWRDVPASVDDAYLTAAERLSLDPRGRDLVRIVYTPLHGVGDVPARQTLARYGFHQVTSVPEQQQPDGDFPTVAFPNPEEPGALDLAYGLGRKTGANLVLANDPDADRLAVALPGAENTFEQLSGNEVGSLLADYLLRATSAQGSRRLVMTTLVSSPLLRRMAEQTGVHYAEVLTGFKWIATTAAALHHEHGWEFLFGYEEALGYTIGTAVRDKDGVSTAAMFAELVAVNAAEGRTVWHELERIGRTYGLYGSLQHGLTRPGRAGQSEIKRLMDTLRQSPPAGVGPLRVTAVRDLQKRTRRTDAGEEPYEEFPSSNVLAFDLDGGARIIARPSGTEPKIKFYFDGSVALDASETYAHGKERVQTFLQGLQRDFLALLPHA